MRFGRLATRGLVIVTAGLAVGCSNSAPGTSSGAPNAPSMLLAGPLGGGVHLTWQDNSNSEQLFEIEREESGTKFALLDTVPFDTGLYHDANVTFGIQYKYRVRAKLDAGYSAFSNEASADPGDVSVGGSSSGTAGSASSTTAGAPSGGVQGASGSAGAQSAGGSGTGGSGTGGSGIGGSGVAGTSMGGATAGAGSVEVSFKKDVAPSLVKSCGGTTGGCHNSDQAVGRILPQFGPCKVIWYSAVDAPLGALYTSGPNEGQATGCPDLDLYSRLTELHSMLCAAPTWDQRPRYVVPFDLDKSLLYQVIDGDPSMGGTCKNMDVPVRKMPLIDPKVLPNGVELGATEIAKIREWILQGAKNN